MSTFIYNVAYQQPFRAVKKRRTFIGNNVDDSLTHYEQAHQIKGVRSGASVMATLQWRQSQLKKTSPDDVASPSRATAEA